MRFSTLVPFLGLAAATPVPGSVFPLKDGFPSPSAAQLKAIEALAGGSIPNGALPTKLSATAVVTLQIIALNEIFEVAYFDTLIKNITSGVPGYESGNNAFDLKSLRAILAQEQLHALGANGILASAGAQTITPCEYVNVVDSFPKAIALANTFTDVVLGVLPQAQTLFGSDGGDETGLVALLGSIIAQEGEQNGWFRTLQNKVPSAAPFLTGEGPTFALTFLASVIVPGSCPGIDIVKKAVPTYGALNVLTPANGEDEVITFSVAGEVSASANSVAYISGQNIPVVEPIYDVQCKDNVSTFKAKIPFKSAGFANGLSIAAVVKGTGSLASIADVASATVFGPGIIEVN